MKFLVLLSAIVALWYVMRWVQQVEASRRVHERRSAAQPRQTRVIRATDTIACPRCGTYVPADHPTACTRPDCPFPRGG